VVVAFPYDYPTSSIVIDASGRRLYYILENKQAYMYPISVGREGFDWTGTETISRKQAWPDWHPPQEMRQRDPRLPEKMTGGTRNPLGAMALYLGTTLYRIHGTNDIKSIGQAQSSGCFRMMNASVVHLASVAEVGTLVTVVASLPKGVEVSQGPGAVPVGPAPGPAPGGPVNPQTRSYDYRDLRDYTLRRW
jgi:lipoprotein-anchoring transpeptidase ErfK/SrfK